MSKLFSDPVDNIDLIVQATNGPLQALRQKRQADLDVLLEKLAGLPSLIEADNAAVESTALALNLAEKKHADALGKLQVHESELRSLSNPSDGPLERAKEDLGRVQPDVTRAEVILHVAGQLRR